MATLASIPTLATAVDEDDLTDHGSAISRWQTRFALGNSAMRRPGQISGAGLMVSNASVMGDYYFGRSLAGLPIPSGFRATSGLIFGPRSLSNCATFASGSAFSVAPIGALSISNSRDLSETTTLPYVGFGYTGLKPNSGWRYNADFGLVAQNPGSLRQFRLQGLDDSMRDLRLAPMLQLGVSYSY